MSEQNQLANISVYNGPVSNTIKKRDVDWVKLAQMLVDKPQFLPDNSSKEKAKGSYYVRGLTNGKRDDDHLLQCSLAILDADKSIDGLPLPFPSEIHSALSDIQHAVHSTATPGRCRIVFPVNPYPKDQTAKVTKAAYDFCRSRGLNFAFSNESKTKSQPFFLPQTTAFCDHQAFAKTDGELFDYESFSQPQDEPEQEQREEREPGYNHLATFIEELQSGTIHQAVKTYSGWLHRTSNLTTKQIFDDINVIVNSMCSDSQKVVRWNSGEREELEKWFSANVDFEEPAEIADPDELLSLFEVRREYVENLGKEQFLYPNLIIRQHIVTIIGMSGSGKTTFVYYEVARLLAKMGLKVWYIDADSPASEHKRMKNFADTHGFRFLNPDVNVGTSVKKLLDMLKSLADKQSDLTDYVFFFDTLKKFADLMSKNSVKDFYVLARRLTKRGATIVLLGHANKYRDKSGNLIFEGVGDVKADGDDLIFLEAAPGVFDDGIDVTTVVDITRGAKVRGIFEPFSFNISNSREISFHDKVIDVASPDERRVPDLEILEAAREYLAECVEPVATTQFVQYVADATGVGLKRVRELIIKHSALKGSEHGPWRMFNYSVGKKNIHLYELPDQGAK